MGRWWWRKKGVLFLKKEPKNFYSGALTGDPARPQPRVPEAAKVFWFFFKKEHLPSRRAPEPRP